MAGKVTDYEIAFGHSERELESMVKNKIKNGMEPFGPMTLNGKGLYLQPCIRFQEEWS